jgi:hypothetical protein
VAAAALGESAPAYAIQAATPALPQLMAPLPCPAPRAPLQEVLDCLDVPPDYATDRPDRAIYCSRTLNLRSIKCIGFDLDYTLLHYDVEAWEGRAYEYGLESLRQQGVPVDGLRFDSSLVIRGCGVGVWVTPLERLAHNKARVKLWVRQHQPWPLPVCCPLVQTANLPQSTCRLDTSALQAHHGQGAGQPDQGGPIWVRHDPGALVCWLVEGAQY